MEISGYRAEIDRERAGLGLTVFISLKVEQHSRETSRSIEPALSAIPAVVACYVVAGDARSARVDRSPLAWVPCSPSPVAARSRRSR